MKFITALFFIASTSVFAGGYDVHYKLTFNDPTAELVVQSKTVNLEKDCAGKTKCQGIIRDVYIVDQLSVEAFSAQANGKIELELVKVSGIDTDPYGTKYPVDTVNVKKNSPTQEFLYPFINNEQLR